jgi:hypothetical protein
LPPEVEDAAGDRHGQRPPRQAQQAAVEPRGPALARRRPGDQREKGEGAGEQAGAEEVDPADGNAEPFDHGGGLA